MLDAKSLEMLVLSSAVFVIVFVIVFFYHIFEVFYKPIKEEKEKACEKEFIPFQDLMEESLTILHYFHNAVMYGDSDFIKSNVLPEFFTVVEKRFCQGGVFSTSHFTKMIAEIISVNYSKGVRTIVVRYNGFVKETEDSNYKPFQEYWYFVDNKTNGWVLSNITQNYKNNKPVTGD